MTTESNLPFDEAEALREDIAEVEEFLTLMDLRRGTNVDHEGIMTLASTVHGEEIQSTLRVSTLRRILKAVQV